MALQFNINRGSGRKKLLSLTNSYHGDTFMCMKAGDDEDYHFILSEDDKKDVIHIPTEMDALEKVFRTHGNEFYAFIVEPLLQGAGGMKMYSIDFLRRARELCNEYDVVLYLMKLQLVSDVLEIVLCLILYFRILSCLEKH